MFRRISLLSKRSFLQKKDNFSKGYLFSPLLLIPLFLVIISGFLIKSIQGGSLVSNYANHILTGFLGYFLAFFISYIPLERLRKYLIPFYFCTLISLLLIFSFGISVSGAQRWLNLGIFSFQPSEVAKLSTVLTLALVLDKKIISKLRDLLLPFLVVILPWLLIFFQPDLGTSLVLLVLTAVMLYWSQMPIEWILLLIFCIFTSILYLNLPTLLIFWIPFIGYLAYRSSQKKTIFSILAISFHLLVAKLTPIMWQFGLKEYQKDRLVLFLDPNRDPLGGGYHLIQSKIAIGSGGIFGTGLLRGKLTNLQFIPEQHTDFIFSALGEELGFVGCMIVLFLFFFLIRKLINTAKIARTDFESLIVIGIAATFLFQIIINLFMTIGLGPVTGIPLPFMSYGRTALVINFISIGCVLSILKRSRKLRI
ncbi:Rod shape-determining protein RodA [Prochlorococcus marinus str. MIT 9321]|uniref:Peptidoglycan glycosyltransferase RodA n=1 Tax=Prochlorococcus marinus str. MIT 9401 TaxID=167551 RepID=A0A0A2B3C4_PROMR|nr:rod shape-determining protein RodA [Prochlorococcus marinus]KGG03153.1 Rod shape-determining protein RodA [Prochlorococcus marinus str. MIT 9321]KGG06541.1 Rod shape-determining protein RodA [Prochlorococcus marinus str. MIT 9322]KGG07642.1 Rod shape-determining protein RodA [Prochlorococcus marinus str. MIT 9401]